MHAGRFQQADWATANGGKIGDGEFWGKQYCFSRAHNLCCHLDYFIQIESLTSDSESLISATV